MVLFNRVAFAILSVAPMTLNAAVLEADALISGVNDHFIVGTVSVDADFSDDSPAGSSAPVSISESASIRGVGQTGTTLGIVNVNGTDDGFFSLSSFGQANHLNEASFRFTETITNTSTITQLFSMNFEISAGMLETSVSEVAPANGEFLQAEYDISINFNGLTVFESGAILRQVGTSSSTTSATLTQTGTSLNGSLTNPETGAPDTFIYNWDTFQGLVDLGVLDSGESGILTYDILTRSSGQFDMCGSSGCGQTIASIGDPLDVSSIGFADDITATAVNPEPVPEPPALLLMLTGIAGMFVARRRSS